MGLVSLEEKLGLRLIQLGLPSPPNALRMLPTSQLPFPPRLSLLGLPEPSTVPGRGKRVSPLVISPRNDGAVDEPACGYAYTLPPGFSYVGETAVDEDPENICLLPPVKNAERLFDLWLIDLDTTSVVVERSLRLLFVRPLSSVLTA